ncbi:MAG TPA: hypothetical protein VLJ86_06985 [Ramlibacter sp.]|nr:hypothetical protein [Ramlibacter sp.]
MNARRSVSTGKRRQAATGVPWALAAATCLSLLAMPAMGQAVYQCGSTYSQQPCEGGRTVNLGDERTTAQRAQAQAAVRRESAAADAMEKARLKDEAKAETGQRRAARTLPYNPASAEPLDMAPSRYDSDPRSSRPDVFVARVPDKPGDRKMAHKAKKPTHPAKHAATSSSKKPAGKTNGSQKAG